MKQTRLDVIEGDITKQQVEAIVNSTDENLSGGGQVNEAVHAAAGPQLLEACLALSGCKTGDAKITKGYNLPAKWVIHAVGPIWQGGEAGEDDLLASAYRRALEVARENNIQTIAIPSISTGAYQFPLERAAHIAMRTITHTMKDFNSFDEITVVCFDKITLEAFRYEMRRHHLLKQAVRSL